MSYVFKSGTERYSNTHISKNHGAPFATSPGKRRAFTTRTGKITRNQLGRSGMQWCDTHARYAWNSVTMKEKEETLSQIHELAMDFNPCLDLYFPDEDKNPKV